MALLLPERTLRRLLLGAAGVVSLLGLVAELILKLAAVSGSFLGLFSLSLEGNLPTWYSSLLLSGCGMALLAVAAGVRQTGAPFFRRWVFLGAVFLFMSLDEAVELHEGLGKIVQLHGVFYFSWVIPASVIVLLMGIAYVPFLLHLPKQTRWRFILAGSIYVAGALVLELPLGFWAERAGTENLGYALIDWIEESMEIFGATLFLLSLISYLAEKHGELRFSPAEAG